MSDGEYPKCAYRLGGPFDVWGRMMDIRHLADATDEAKALSQGWSLHPLDISEPLIAEEVQPIKRGPGRPRKLEA